MLHGFVKVATWICQSCSKYFSPYAKQNQAKVWFQSLLKLLLWPKGSKWVKLLNDLGPSCLWQCLKGGGIFPSNAAPHRSPCWGPSLNKLVWNEKVITAPTTGQHSSTAASPKHTFQLWRSCPKSFGSLEVCVLHEKGKYTQALFSNKHWGSLTQACCTHNAYQHDCSSFHHRDHHF